MTGPDDDIATVRDADQLDWAALDRWLHETIDLPDAPLTVQQFTAGRANLTYLVTIGATKVVVRRPPKGTIAPGAHDMAREAKVLDGLRDAYPRAPRLLAFCEDISVIGAPFVVTEFRDGVVVQQDVPSSMVDIDDVTRRLDLALVDAAADLHAIDIGAVGLGDLGRPDGFAARQVSGWTDRWHRAAPGEPIPVMDEVAEALGASVPSPPKASIIHLDLKLDNCRFAASDPDTVTSVFDWDMATLGDPLFDLGLMVSSSSAMPVWTISTDEVIDRYRHRSGIEVADFGWYLSFATWRTAVVLQQLANRWLSGDSADDRLAGFAAHVPVLGERARELLAGRR